MTMLEEYIKQLTTEKLDKLLAYLQPMITPQRFSRFKEVLNRRTKDLVVVLEDIYQGHNASAIIRTCDGYGIQYVYAIENRNLFKPNDEIALGADKWVNIIHFQGEKAIEQAYHKLRKEGKKIIATAFTSDAINLREIEISSPVALVFGTEKEGLTQEAIELADMRCVIPMEGFTTSFNVSVSAAISLEIVTQKMEKAGFKRGLPEEEKKRLLVEWILKTISNPEEILETFLQKT